MAQIRESQVARLESLTSRRWTYTSRAGWHTLSRMWHGAPLTLSGSNLDRLLDRVEQRQADFEADLERFKSNRAPGVPVAEGLSHT